MLATLLAQLDQLETQARAELAGLRSSDALQALRVRYLGRKGLITGILSQLGHVAREDKPQLGNRANQCKQFIESECDRLGAELASQQIDIALTEQIDVTLPGRLLTPRGCAHPVMQMQQRIEGIFADLGFSIFDGPEVESDYYNFEALNIPADHPARDMQDTFYVQGSAGASPLLLRTHTSPVQIRVMKNQPPPIRMIAPGAVFRRDADVTHSPMFHQVEGLVVDRRVTFAQLQWTLTHFLEQIFGVGVRTRFRPSFFPFTEPSAEIDIGYVRSDSAMRMARGSEAVTGWLEVLGCGMVDPAVFEAVGYDPDQVSGFAFGLGVERFAMLQHGIDDIRLLFESDVRFLEQLSL